MERRSYNITEVLSDDRQKAIENVLWEDYLDSATSRLVCKFPEKDVISEMQTIGELVESGELDREFIKTGIDNILNDKPFSDSSPGTTT